MVLFLVYSAIPFFEQTTELTMEFRNDHHHVPSAEGTVIRATFFFYLPPNNVTLWDVYCCYTYYYHLFLQPVTQQCFDVTWSYVLQNVGLPCTFFNKCLGCCSGFHLSNNVNKVFCFLLLFYFLLRSQTKSKLPGKQVASDDEYKPQPYCLFLFPVNWPIIEQKVLHYAWTCNLQHQKLLGNRW